MHPHTRRATLYVDHARPRADRQERLALQFAARAGLDVVALCQDPETCTALVRSGAVGVVVAALSVELKVIEMVEAAGGSVAVVRPEVAPRARRGVRGIATRMRQRGIDTGEIAVMLAMPVNEVRRLLRRNGR